jgi:hypothetical protein
VHASAKLRLNCGFHHDWCNKKRIALKLRHFSTFYTPQPPQKSIKIPKNPPPTASQTVQKSEMLCKIDRLPDPRRVFVFCG